MDFREYQELAKRTAKPDQSFEDAILECALGVAAEAGELANLIKKWRFHGHTLSHVELRGEGGDTLWYLARLMGLLGIPLEEMALANIRKLEERYPEGFDEKRSRERDE